MKPSAIVTLVSILIVFALGMFFVGRISKPAETEFVINPTTIVEELRELNRLETVAFSVEKVIEAGTTGSAFSEFLFGDRILLVAHGQVIAGFDLSKLTPESIVLSEEKTILQLPAPEIFSASLDTEATRVYDRTLGLLTKGDAQLETKTRQAAEKIMRESACQSGILEDATINGKRQLTAFLNALGVTSLSIEVLDTLEQDTCK